MKKYKPMTLEVQVSYVIELEPEDYAEYQDGKPINQFDHWDDSGSEPKVINEYPTE